ncbi:NUDIX domain-containing protein [Roseobacter sp. HKCCA0434]|uniref:NUDIX domain-containing protein n=1 Tax=Roseobacter sp. HKCCA0434 TaxID=3079297 RepID=UPI002905EE98|nr:NUDIX domain-containing protein [Roseobacter sp. HKCCA0434]
MARQLFFYGTLRDRATLDVVMGPQADAIEAVPARLRDHAVMSVVGEDYPTILAAPGQVAEGVLVRGLAPEAIARLSYFEDDFDYGLVEHVVETEAGEEPAEVFFVHADHLRPGPPWDFEAWSREKQPAFHQTAGELMSLYGQVPDEKVDDVWPGIRFRAYARARATGEEDTVRLRSGLGRDDVELHGRTRPYVDYFAVEDLEVSHATFAGGRQGPMRRAIFATGDAVAVLPFDPRTGQVLLIEQFRPAPLARGAGVPWLLEPVAGRIDSAEDPEATARREAREEAGVELGRLDPLPPFYSSPGTVTEKMFCYVAECDLSDAGGIHGLDDEHEDIRSILVDTDALGEVLGSGEVENGPLLALIQHLLLHRARLLQEWG